MINLIPNKEKKKMVREFYYKLAILSLIMLSISIFLATLLLLPAYFLSSSKNNTNNQKLKSQKVEPIPAFDQETLTIIKDINKQLSLIETSEKNKFSVSEKVINAILSKKTSSIKITQISYKNTLPDGKKINISGTAPSREVLLKFRQAFENDQAFKNINLPISNFVKGSNIQFSLSLIPT